MSSRTLIFDLLRNARLRATVTCVCVLQFIDAADPVPPIPRTYFIRFQKVFMRMNLGLVLFIALLGIPLAHATQIVVGQLGPMSGLDANQGRAYAVGMQLLFNNVNKTGDVNGHTFTLVRKDDGGRPQDTGSATK